MKKITLFFLSLCLLLPLSSCGKEGSASSEKDLYKAGLDLIDTMSEMLGSEEYAKISGLSDSSVLSVAECLDTGDYDDPVAVYQIELPDIEEYFESLEDYDEDLWDDLSSNLKKQLENRFTFGTIASRINSRTGERQLAFGSVYQAIDSDGNFNVEETTTFLYVFEEGTPIAITFSKHGTMQGQFVFMDDTDSLSDVKKIFKPYKCSVSRVDYE